MIQNCKYADKNNCIFADYYPITEAKRLYIRAGHTVCTLTKEQLFNHGIPQLRQKNYSQFLYWLQGCKYVDKNDCLFTIYCH